MFAVATANGTVLLSFTCILPAGAPASGATPAGPPSIHPPVIRESPTVDRSRLDFVQLRSESVRLSTFHDWPSSGKTQRLREFKSSRVQKLTKNGEKNSELSCSLRSQIIYTFSPLLLNLFHHLVSSVIASD